MHSDPNGLYRGDWHWDPEKKLARGNPASAKEVREMVRAVISRDATLGERQHSAAMSKEYMDRIMAWSDQECPKEMIASLVPCLDEFAKMRPKVTKHLFMWAFASSGWTLWTRWAFKLHRYYRKLITTKIIRNFELAKLQAKQYRQNLQTQDEYRWTYDECHLEHRKGWLHHMSKDGDLECKLISSLDMLWLMRLMSSLSRSQISNSSTTRHAISRHAFPHEYLDHIFGKICLCPCIRAK